jgi:lipopolysaccharide transport system ATP-binding protein
VGVGDTVSLVARARVNAPLERMVFGYMIRDRLGQPVFGTNTSHTDQAVTGLAAGDLVEFTAKFEASFGPGSYSVSLALSSTETHLVNNYQWKDMALMFTVANLRHPTFVGVAHAPPRISISLVAGGDSCTA